MNTEKFEIVAKTFQGLEDVLAEELKNLGAEDRKRRTNSKNQFGLSNSSENTETYL